MVCGNPWLLGEWDFVGHPIWPRWLVLLRDAAQLFFYGSAWGFLGVAAVGAVQDWLGDREILQRLRLRR